VFVLLLHGIGRNKSCERTQKYQLAVIMSGMIVADGCFQHLPDGMSFGDTFRFAGEMGKMNLINLNFNLSDRYNIWSGLIGGLFLISPTLAPTNRRGAVSGRNSVTEAGSD